MSRSTYLGTKLDDVLVNPLGRVPRFKVLIWNPNRCTVQDVVLGQAASPRYDITPWVISADYSENICFENNDDAVVGNVSLKIARDVDASPIPISERTLVDGTPLRLYEGDERVPESEWALIFTGVVRGNPTMVENARDENTVQIMDVLAVDRAEKYLNTVVTARSYTKGDDIGKVVVETAIEHMGLLRREIDIGDQGYFLGHEQSQVVDMAVLPAIHQILFCVGKKPKFDGSGHLVAADTSFSKPAARSHLRSDLVASIARSQRMLSINNSVRLLGLDDELTRVVERVKRLAHGQITAGYYEESVNQNVWFSEQKTTAEGGRKAQDTFLRERLHGNSIVGGNISWTPWLESDGVSCFGGKVSFDTGYYPGIQAAITALYAVLTVVIIVCETNGNAALAVGSYSVAASWYEASKWADTVRWATLIALLLTMTILGRVEYEIYGKPIQNVFQQISATAQLSGVLTEDVKELEIRNDWIYDLDVLVARAKEILKRELAKGWTYEIVMASDPVLEVDDVLEIGDARYYVTSISKTLSNPPTGTMTVTAWRIA